MALEPRQIQQGLTRIPNVNNTLAVASGKGGVGKSTTAVNLACALKLAGLRVGLLDADIYGPNQPTMLGVCKRPIETDNKKLEPIISHGIASMSIAYLIGPDAPMIWRGPMVSRALEQLVFETNWPPLDILIIDLPPGTGDVQLTLAQKIPLTGALIVTTPQEVACQDARKAIAMFAKVNIPVLGIVENMQLHVCSACGHTETVFGEGGAKAIASSAAIPYFAGIPLDKRIGQLADKGIPIVAQDPTGSIATVFADIGQACVGAIDQLPKDYASKFGKIKIQSE